MFRRLAAILGESDDFVQDSADILCLGTEYLGVDNGHITRIDPQTDLWMTIGSSSPNDGDFPVGLTVDLGETYCRRTLDSGATIALHDAPAEGWDGDPAYEAHGLRTYVGTPFSVAGRPYGTVCFVARDARPEPFSKSAIAFVEFLAALVGRTLEAKRQEELVADKEEVITTLSRVLRHNLSNNINVVQAHAAMLEANVDPELETHVDAIRANATDLAALAEKARDLQRMVSTDYRRTPMDLRRLLSSAVQTVGQSSPTADIALDCPDDVAVNALPILETAVAELVENAVVHAGDAPRVEVAGRLSQRTFTVRVADDGGGLPEMERQVLEDGVETPLTHGSGLGLWMDYWIAQRHDGTVEAADTAAGTTVEVTIPNSTATVPSEITRDVP